MTTQKPHPFQVHAGWKPPYKIVGMQERVIKHPDGTVQPSGTCDYCGTGIRYCFEIRDADMQTHIVGCDCVEKTYNPKYSVKGFNRAIHEHKARLRREANERRKARERVRVAEAKEKWPSVRDLFVDKPHPFGREGESMANYIDFLFFNGGLSGKMKAVRMIDKATK